MFKSILLSAALLMSAAATSQTGIGLGVGNNDTHAISYITTGDSGVGIHTSFYGTLYNNRDETFTRLPPGNDRPAGEYTSAEQTDISGVSLALAYRLHEQLTVFAGVAYTQQENWRRRTTLSDDYQYIQYQYWETSGERSTVGAVVGAAYYFTENHGMSVHHVTDTGTTFLSYIYQF